MEKALEEVSDSDEECCGVCLMPPEENEAYRLELCGHLMCSTCLKMQLAAGELPMRCSQEVSKKRLRLVLIFKIFIVNFRTVIAIYAFKISSSSWKMGIAKHSNQNF